MASRKKQRDKKPIPTLGIEEYVRAFAAPLPIVEKMRRSAKRKRIDKISMRTINQEIKRARRELRDNVPTKS
jgi:hypothetical protein